MKIEFDLLKSNYGNKLNTSKFKYGKIVMIVLPIFAIILVDMFKLDISLIFVGVIYLGLSYLLSKLLQKSDEKLIQEITNQIIGTIKLEEDKIEITLIESERQPSSRDIIEININSYFGEVTGYGRHQELHYGTDTTIKLNVNEKSELLYVFIRHKEDRDKFKLISTWCLKANSQYKEYTKSERTYNGKKLSYMEIQELKKNISDNYGNRQ